MSGVLCQTGWRRVRKTEERSRLEEISEKLFSDQHNNGDQRQELHTILLIFLTCLCFFVGLDRMSFKHVFLIFFEYFSHDLFLK